MLALVVPWTSSRIRLARLAVPLSPGVTLHVAGDSAASGIALTVADLTRYAQTGATADWGSPAGAEDALLDVGESLWSRPVDGAEGWGVDDLRAALAADDAPEDGVRLAIGCALARWLVWRGEAVTLGELAALAGVTVSAVRLYAHREQIATHAVTGERRTHVAADEARRWLAARGVAGWR